MSGFKKSSIEISVLSSPIIPNVNAVTVRATSGNKLQVNNINNIEEVLAYESLVGSISGNLQGQLNLIPGSYASIGSLSAYTPLSTTSAISAFLNDKIDSINLVQGSNITIVESPANTFTISSIGGGGGGSGFTPVQGTGISITAPTTASYQFSVIDYISKTEVSGVSATLGALITVETNSRISSDNFLQSQLVSISGNFAQIGMLSAYTPLSTTSGISGNLQGQLNLIPGSYASIGSLSGYTPLSTTSAISAQLNSKIDSINLVQGSNITIVESPTNTWTISSIGGGGSSWEPIQGTGISITAPTTASYQFSVIDYISKSEVTGVSATLNALIDVEVNSRINADSFIQSQLNVISGSYASIGLLSGYTPLTTTSSISGNLQGQINNKASIGSLSAYTPLTTTSDISAQLNSKIDSISLVQGSNITIVESPTNTWTISGVASSGSGSSTLSGLSDVSITSPVTGQILVSNGTQWINKYPSRNIPFTIVSSTVIVSGTKDTMFVAPWNGSITDWIITCTPASTIIMDVLKGEGVVPTNSIISSNNPSLSASQIGFETTSGWTTSFIKNDVFKVKVLSNTLATTITLQLNCNIIG